MDFQDQQQGYPTWESPDVNLDEFLDFDEYANDPNTALLSSGQDYTEDADQSFCTDDWTLSSGVSSNSSQYSPLTVPDALPKPQWMISSENIDPTLYTSMESQTSDDFVDFQFVGSDRTFSEYTSSISPTTNSQQTTTTFHTLNMTTEPINTSKSQPRTAGRKRLDPDDLKKNQRKITKPETCHVCGKGHTWERELDRHMVTNHRMEAERMGIDVSKTKCPHCDLKVDSIRKERLRKHAKRIHGVVLKI